MIRFAGDDHCREGQQHEDPDNSGLCIKCFASMDPSVWEVVEAMEDGRAPASMPDAVRYAAHATWSHASEDPAEVELVMLAWESIRPDRDEHLARI